jgi:hypothetical protein
MSKYQLLEASLADLDRLYQFKQEDLFNTDFSLKGFDYPWIVKSHLWKPGEKVLDVGAAYSPLPIHLQNTYGCEMWVADDFGMNSNDPFWTRNASPQEHIARNPNVKFVFERLGDPATSSLPAGYFDVVYSASVLEHVPAQSIRKVWRHLDLLLKPGGEMLHAIDIPFPSNGGVKKILFAMGFDTFHFAFSKEFKARHFLSTPMTCARLAFSELDIQAGLGNALSALNMALNPVILTESAASGLRRITHDKMTSFHYSRVGSLMLRFKKVA